MSSVEQGLKTKQELLEEYEKDYLERLEQKEKEPEDLQNMIFEEEKKAKELEKKEYIGFCAFCMMGVARDEMVYKNNLLFHPNCFEQQGKNFPAVNQLLLKQNSNAKVELALLKNLKARTIGASNPASPIARPKIKKKSKRKAKKRRPKRRTAKRRTKKRRVATKRRKTKRQTKRKSAKRRRTAAKRRKGAKRRKVARRKARRRPARRTRRRSTKRRARRRRR